MGFIGAFRSGAGKVVSWIGKKLGVVSTGAAVVAAPVGAVYTYNRIQDSSGQSALADHYDGIPTQDINDKDRVVLFYPLWEDNAGKVISPDEFRGMNVQQRNTLHLKKNKDGHVEGWEKRIAPGTFTAIARTGASYINSDVGVGWETDSATGLPKVINSKKDEATVISELAVRADEVKNSKTPTIRERGDKTDITKYLPAAVGVAIAAGSAMAGGAWAWVIGTVAAAVGIAGTVFYEDIKNEWNKPKTPTTPPAGTTPQPPTTGPAQQPTVEVPKVPNLGSAASLGTPGGK